MTGSGAAPRLSASVLLLKDDPFEVLMVQRSARGAFPSALVFPGGAIEASDGDDSWAGLTADFDSFGSDQRAVRIGAIREVWEETGILIGAGGAGTRVAGARESDDRGPGSVQSGGEVERGDFGAAIGASGSALSLASLTHFAHWITPVVEPRRFDTHFYLAMADPNQSAIPDLVETTTAEWVSPAVALDWAQTGSRQIIFPTMVNLARLVESGSAVEAIKAALEHEVHPVQPEIELLESGVRRITIRGESDLPITEWTQFPTAGK
ncbi:MAG: NUDIX domain-containing protein [Cryobacterium sp.]|nr:NUDIX domain-containing protein [Cryobacterium sp.]